jgi:hypothetical protein
VKIEDIRIGNIRIVSIRIEEIRIRNDLEKDVSCVKKKDADSSNIQKKNVKNSKENSEIVFSIK